MPYSLLSRSYRGISAFPVFFCFLLVAHAAAFGANVISRNSSWKYYDSGGLSGSSWTTLGYNDSGWSSASGILGFGDGQSPQLSSGNITYYFRKTVNVVDPSGWSDLDIELIRDDGAVIYINGTEVWRSNMPTGTVPSSTVASAVVSGGDESTYFLQNVANTLVTGNNIIAVEIHQQNASSSDVSFNTQYIVENASGCNADTFNITVLAICDTNEVTINNTTCYPDSAGTTVETLSTYNGCDSVVTTNTLLLESYDLVYVDSTCNPAEVDTQVFIYTASNGCDSVITMIKELYVYSRTTIRYSTCDHTLTGSTVEHFPAYNGCDSVVTTIVTYDGAYAGFVYTQNDLDVSFTNTSINSNSWYWDFGDGNFSVLEHPAHTYAGQGNYNVLLIASNESCGGDSVELLVSIIINSIDQLSFAESVQAYPNPSSGSFDLELKGTPQYRLLELELIDVNGSVLEARSIPYDGLVYQHFDIEYLPAGMYFLRIRSGMESMSLKVHIIH